MLKVKNLHDSVSIIKTSIPMEFFIILFWCAYQFHDLSEDIS